jgi:hypothetical protein
MTIEEKKKKIKALVTKTFNKLDPEGYNAKKFAEFIDGLSEAKFKEFVKKLNSGEWRLTIEMPNMTSRIDINDAFEAADDLGVEIFHRLRMTDPTTGQQILSDRKYAILELPVRRTQQTIDHKMSVPEDDRRIDMATGQVVGPDQASRFGKEQIQILYNRNLTMSLREILQIRGGNPRKYAEFAQQLIENGEADIDTLDPEDRTRVAQITKIMMQSMHLDVDF